jgi:hypothetical protein
MDYAWKLRNAFIESTRGYFSTTSDVVVSDNDLPYYDGEDFFDKKHRLNVHYHASLTSSSVTVASGSTAEEGAPPVTAEVVQEVRPAPQKLPVVVFIHGGGWKRGDRNYICDAYNNFGKAVAAYVWRDLAVAAALCSCLSLSRSRTERASWWWCPRTGYRWRSTGVCSIPSMLTTSLMPFACVALLHSSRLLPVGFCFRDSQADSLSVLVQWVKENIGRYNGDVDMVFLSGALPERCTIVACMM